MNFRALKSKATAKKQSSKIFDLFTKVQSKETVDDAVKLPEIKTSHCSIPTKALHKPPAHESEINCIRVSRDGSLLATGGNDKKVIVYDAKTGLPLPPIVYVSFPTNPGGLFS